MCLRNFIHFQYVNIQHVSSISLIKSFILLFIFGALPHNQMAQSTNGIHIRTLEMRGQDPLMALSKSIVESRKDVVVVLIRGGNEELIRKAKGELKALHHIGFNRVGIILCDIKPNEEGMVIAIFSDGTIFAIIKGARPDTRTMSDFYTAVKEVYIRDVLPKVEASKH